jgi:hypothetical protein
MHTYARKHARTHTYWLAGWKASIVLLVAWMGMVVVVVVVLMVVVVARTHTL